MVRIGVCTPSPAEAKSLTDVVRRIGSKMQNLELPLCEARKAVAHRTNAVEQTIWTNAMPDGAGEERLVLGDSGVDAFVG
mmetsp:Transcript_52460/g.123121  ORF Transcript_52460/g.123121 Transcript_52460/m.123121 type:complete len:80 (-) Transcript_52460:3-242(-)|eukprot:897787-Rhodomonas_salina.4